MLPGKQQLLQFIRNVHPMPMEKAESIVDRFHEQHFSKNAFVLKDGKYCREYHFLCSGFMRAWTIDLEGKEVTTAFYPAGNVVCELFSFFKHTPARENIQALTDCTSVYISFDELQEVFHSMPEFREFGRSILVNAYASLKQRVLSTLHETAEQRYRQVITAAPEIFQFAPLKHIASYLGITESSLSRIRKEFAKEH